MKQIVRYKNGFSLSYAEYGDKNGFPILIQHGLIASINDCDLFNRLIGSGARLICMARPGYGRSSPYALKNIAEWAEIVSILMDELKLSQFDILGMSSGAPYSYAIGSRLPEKVRNIFIFSGTPALCDQNILTYWPYPVNKDADIAELQKLAHELFFSGVSKTDAARHDIHDSMLNNCFGIALDLRIRVMDWGFSPSDVSVPVYMQHSRFDTAVPFITAEMTARLLPKCNFMVQENDVHFSPETLDDFIQRVMLPHFRADHSPKPPQRSTGAV
jgi:pimeloyl-ACP methyl ester carboxylesterase